MAADRLFSPDSDSGVALLRWFDRLDLGQRARLRRCHDPLDVVLEPSFHRLAATIPDADPQRLAPIVWTLSHLKDNDTRHLGVAFKSVLSELRFRRILEANDRVELANDLRTSTSLLRKRANILDIARIIYFWGRYERRRLATEYFGATE